MKCARKTVLIVFSVIAAIVLVAMAYCDQKQQHKQTEEMESIMAEVAPYERELEAIEEELEDMSAAIPYVSDTARFIIAFELSDVSDLSYIQEQAEAYQFSPVIVLDCTDDLEKLETYVDAAEDTDWEIMLFADVFSEEVNEAVLTVLAALEDRGMEDSGVFLLRDTYLSTENIQLLLEDGFIGYTVYNETPTDGYTSDGAIYFDYSYMRMINETINSRVSAAYRDKCASLILFDMENVWNGTMSESYVRSVLDIVAAHTEYDDACFSTVADVVAQLQSVQEIETLRQEEYDAYAVELQERIEELNEIIDGIYSKLSDLF